MNRREFAKSIAALGLLPAMPSLTALAPVQSGASGLYGLGVHFARTQGACSPAMLGAKLGLSPNAAQVMHAQLIRSGVLSLPTTSGFAVATQPFMRRATASGLASRPVRGKLQKLKKWLLSDTTAETLSEKEAVDAPDQLI